MSTFARFYVSAVAALVLIPTQALAQDNPPPPETATILLVSQGHVSLTPLDQQTGLPSEARRIIVPTGKKAVLASGGVPVVTVMSAAERDQLAIGISRLMAFVPASPNKPQPKRSTAAPTSVGSPDEAGKKHHEPKHEHHDDDADHHEEKHKHH